MSEQVNTELESVAVVALERLERVLALGRAVEQSEGPMVVRLGRGSKLWAASVLARRVDEVETAMESYVSHWRQARAAGCEEPLVWWVGWLMLAQAVVGLMGAWALVEPDAEMAQALWRVAEAGGRLGGDDAAQA